MRPSGSCETAGAEVASPSTSEVFDTDKALNRPYKHSHGSLVFPASRHAALAEVVSRVSDSPLKRTGLKRLSPAALRRFFRAPSECR
jgi:hypothetical protein